MTIDARTRALTVALKDVDNVTHEDARPDKAAVALNVDYYTLYV